MNYGEYGPHSPYRYGKNNEAPPGEYYLIKKKPGQKHSMYLSDNGKSPYIKGILGHGKDKESLYIIILLLTPLAV